MLTHTTSRWQYIVRLYVAVSQPRSNFFEPNNSPCLLLKTDGPRLAQESAQFSAMAVELSDSDTVGTALTLQMALGFSVTVLGIFTIPLVEVCVCEDFLFDGVIPSTVCATCQPKMQV